MHTSTHTRYGVIATDVLCNSFKTPPRGQGCGAWVAQPRERWRMATYPTSCLVYGPLTVTRSPRGVPTATRVGRHTDPSFFVCRPVNTGNFDSSGKLTSHPAAHVSHAGCSSCGRRVTGEYVAGFASTDVAAKGGNRVWKHAWSMTWVVFATFWFSHISRAIRQNHLFSALLRIIAAVPLHHLASHGPCACAFFQHLGGPRPASYLYVSRLCHHVFECY